MKKITIGNFPEMNFIEYEDNNVDELITITKEKEELFEIIDKNPYLKDKTKLFYETTDFKQAVLLCEKMVSCYQVQEVTRVEEKIYIILYFDEDYILFYSYLINCIVYILIFIQMLNLCLLAEKEIVEDNNIKEKELENNTGLLTKLISTPPPAEEV